MTRSTASRRARNSDSVRIGGRRRPASRPSRRRCFLASRRVEPLTLVTSSPTSLGRALDRGSRTRTTVFGGSSGQPSSVAVAAATTATAAALVAPPSPSSSSSPASDWLALVAGPASSAAPSSSSPVRRLRPRPPRRRRRRRPASSPSSSSAPSPSSAPVRRSRSLSLVGCDLRRPPRSPCGASARPARRAASAASTSGAWKSGATTARGGHAGGVAGGAIAAALGRRPAALAVGLLGGCGWPSWPASSTAASAAASAALAGGAGLRRVLASPSWRRLLGGRLLRRPSWRPARRPAPRARRGGVRSRRAGGPAGRLAARRRTRLAVAGAPVCGGGVGAGLVEHVAVLLSGASSGSSPGRAHRLGRGVGVRTLVKPSWVRGEMRAGCAGGLAPPTASGLRSLARSGCGRPRPGQGRTDRSPSSVLRRAAPRQPGHPWGDRRHQVGHLSQGGEDVVGSYGRCCVPYDQVEYRTGVAGGRRWPPARSARRIDRAAGVERAPAVLRHPLDLDLVRGQQRRDRRRRPASARRPGSSIRQTLACSRSAKSGVRGLDHLDHVEARAAGRRPGRRAPRSGSQPLGDRRSRGTRPRWPRPSERRWRRRSSGAG